VKKGFDPDTWGLEVSILNRKVLAGDPSRIIMPANLIKEAYKTHLGVKFQQLETSNEIAGSGMAVSYTPTTIELILWFKIVSDELRLLAELGQDIFNDNNS
jgi:hypothetical protein